LAFDHEMEDAMIRKTAVIVAGLAMAASVGLVGAGTASAAAPALHIANDSKWTVEIDTGGCEVTTFHSNFTWKSDVPGGDAGIWKGGGSTLKMKWLAGADAPLVFKGTFTTSPRKEYKGAYSGVGPGFNGQVVEGVVKMFDGTYCTNSPPA
jgi:hypothetical protein